MSNRSQELRESGLSNLTTEELRERMKALREQARHWLDAQDGSYEMALEHDGYNAYAEEYRRRRNQE